MYRLLTFSNFQVSSTPIFADLKMLKLSDLVEILNVITISNFPSNSVPQSLIILYDLSYYSISHDTRGSILGLLAKPFKRTKIYGLNSIIYQSVVQWNE